jgi:Zn-dependent protease
MLFSNITLPVVLSRAVTLVIAFTIHELSHALLADYFGDDLPRSQGRITLDPRAHLDPIGSLMLLVSGFGWAKPVMVNTYVLRMVSPAAPMLVSLAGPLSNFFMAAIAAIPLKAGLLPLAVNGRFFPSPYGFLTEFVVINLVLTFLNLIPLPPLDGYTIAMYFLPEGGRRVLQRLEPYGAIILLVIFLSGIAWFIIQWPVRLFLNLLT